MAKFNEAQMDYMVGISAASELAWHYAEGSLDVYTADSVLADAPDGANTYEEQGVRAFFAGLDKLADKPAAVAPAEQPARDSIESLRAEMMEWLQGRRSCHNQMSWTPETQDQSVAYRAMADAAEVMKLSSAIQALVALEARVVPGE
jgi:hypothetical protein